MIKGVPTKSYSTVQRNPERVPILKQLRQESPSDSTTYTNKSSVIKKRCKMRLVQIIYVTTTETDRGREVTLLFFFFFFFQLPRQTWDGPKINHPKAKIVHRGTLTFLLF